MSILQPDPQTTNPVGQSGEVTPGHPVAWTTDGVVQDAGTPDAGDLTGVGIQKAEGLGLGIATGPQSGPYTLFGLGYAADGNAQISLASYGGAPARQLEFLINGVLTTFPPSGGGGGGGSGTVTSITAGLGLTGGTITNAGTIALANTTVVPGSYTNTNLTVNQQGQIISAISGSGGGGTSLPWVSPEDYGAVADGVTDNTTAINNMVAGAPAGALVFWRAGTYLVTGTITVGKAMNWVGAGRQTTTIATNQATTNMLVFNADVNISNMGFNCSVTATSGYMLTFNSGTTRMRMEQFWILNAFSSINLNGPSDIALVDGQIFNWQAGGTGILYTGGEAALFDNIIMQQGTRPGNGHGIVVNNGGITINNCQLLACGLPLVLQPGSGQAVVSMWVMNTGFDNSSSGVIIQPTGSGFVGRCWFIGCWMSSMDNEGVYINATSTLSSVDGVDFVNCHVFANGAFGFNITNQFATNLHWLGCRIAGNVQEGISFFAGGQFFSVIGCTIGGYGGFNQNSAGAINLGSTCADYRIVDNDLSNAGINPLVGAGVQSGPRPGVTELIYGNIGYVSQNRGGATVPAGALNVTVAHGLSGTPRLVDIQITNLTGLGNPPGAAPFVISPTASTFVIELGIPLSNDATFAWKAMLPCSI